MSNEKHETPGKIDYGQALRRGLEKISRDDPDGGSTERLRRPGEHPAPTRTVPVKEACLSLSECLYQSKRRQALGDSPGDDCGDLPQFLSTRLRMVNAAIVSGRLLERRNAHIERRCHDRRRKLKRRCNSLNTAKAQHSEVGHLGQEADATQQRLDFSWLDSGAE